ncbi:MAG: hypothetical protein GX589_02680, partial [Deltaproteobacteria bacterium]|nr:hypothetical protein [Deltaproteobacteria bacterium]
PTLGQERYLLRKSTAIAAYKGLIDLYDRVQKLKHPELLNRADVLLALTSKDGLVSTKRTKTWLLENQQSNWQVLELEAKPQISNTHDHVLLDQAGLGESAWEELVSAVLRHFKPEAKKQEQESSQTAD